MAADDQFERYYAEKLWEWIPSLYRHEDGIAERPGTLRAFVELIAEQVAMLRRSHDRLWDDAFIDLCDDWAVPYLGDLVGTRLVSALNKRGRRVDVAKTIYYRRRKGTPRVLEELIADITGWEGKVVESFRFLGRFHHHLDPALGDRLEPARGWADLKSVRIAEQAGGPWDPFAHTADIRKPRGEDGRWNIPRVSFHLFRLSAFRLLGVQPHARADGMTFTFDPSGRDGALFMPRLREPGFSWDDWHSARPWEVPAPMGCRVLGHAEYVIDDATLAAMNAGGLSPAALAELTIAAGARFTTERALHDYLENLTNQVELLAAGNYDRLRRHALVEDCGKHALWPDAVEVVPTTGAVPRERMSAAGLEPWTTLADDVDLLVDPVRGRFKFFAVPGALDGLRVDYVTGFGGTVGAGSYDRRDSVADVPDAVVPAGSGQILAAHYHLVAGQIDGITELPDSATYMPQANPTNVVRLVLQAANLQRPFVRLTGDWSFTSAPGVEATLAIDGLWIGDGGGGAAIVIRGTWRKVELRWTTLDPGGTDADGNPILPVPIFVEGQVDELVIDHSIASRVATRFGGVIDRIHVADSILDSTAAPAPGVAIALTPGTVTLRRVTVLGGVDVERLDASEALITGTVDVTDTQVGCFRFSSAPAGSRLPHPYRWVPWSGGAVFSSTRFGDAGYTWLAQSAPEALRRGGENGAEIGVWNSALVSIKEDSLLRKVDEYLPFGLSPMFVRET